jgi:transposase
MLGPPKPRRLAEPIAVSLEQLVPAYHFYRHLEAKLDLSFVCDLVNELSAETGRPSLDPVIFFKLRLIMFFERLRSERHLMQAVANRHSLHWYLGYDLSEPLPTTPASPASGSATDWRSSTASSRRSSSNASPG